MYQNRQSNRITSSQIHLQEKRKIKGKKKSLSRKQGHFLKQIYYSQLLLLFHKHDKEDLVKKTNKERERSGKGKCSQIPDFKVFGCGKEMFCCSH